MFHDHANAKVPSRPMSELKTRVLVVDDDQRLRDLVVRYLSEQGFEVRAVSDAAGMDKQLARERYDLEIGRAHV